MTFYWRGYLNFDTPDGILSTFYEKASADLRGHALSEEGRRLHNTKTVEQIPSEVLDRLRALWERRLASAQADAHPEAYAAELSAFGWWFASAKFEDAWAIDQLMATLKISPSMQTVDHLVSERLAALAAAMPQETVECLRLLAEGDTEGWRLYAWRGHARTILSTATQGADAKARESAVDLIHRLGARGYFDFRDLLPKTISSR
jgi:hypothetical protein